MSSRPPIRTLLGLAALLAACSAGGGEPGGAGGASTSAAPAATGSRPATTPATRSPAATTTPSGSAAAPGPVEPASWTTLAGGFEVPWGLAFLPDGDALVSERDTALVKRVTPDGQVSTVGRVPGVVPAGEGGLLGLAVAPTYAQDHLLYAYFTADDDNRVVRMRVGDGLSEPEVLLSGIPKAGNHDGGRLAFGPDRMLYVSTGDAGLGDPAQDVGSLAGKVLRITPDGRVPDGNPFAGSPVWSYGHRNVQGLAFDPEGRLWAGEFGQQTYDELNLVRPGANYGWPLAEGPVHESEFVDPVAAWNPTSTASPSGTAWVRDTVFLGALAGEALLSVPVPGGRAGPPRAYERGHYGRLRTVVAAPDGSLWVTTSNTDGRGDPRDGDDRILRVTLRPLG